VVVGGPDNGKTFFMRWATRSVGNLVVYDSKWDVEDGWDETNRFAVVERPWEMWRAGRVVLRVPQVWSFRVTVGVGTQIANHIDTRLLRLAKHVFVMGPEAHEDDIEHVSRRTRCDPEPLRKLRKWEVAWWREGARKWTVFRPVSRRRGGLQQRARGWGRWVRWGMAAAGWVSWGWVGGARGTEVGLGLVAVAAAWGARAWRGRRWGMECEWEEVELQEERRPEKEYSLRERRRGWSRRLSLYEGDGDGNDGNGGNGFAEEEIEAR
jgi:hypothetical protein